MSVTRLSALLALLGLALLLASLAPWTGGEVDSYLGTDLTAAGRALFLAKGCTTCHRHQGLDGLGTASASFIGPELTTYQPDADFVRRWLRDPAAIRPGTAMPDLDLSEREITALIAFLGADDSG
jgi:mono/diheme cytochrome c family protein